MTARRMIPRRRVGGFFRPPVGWPRFIGSAELIDVRAAKEPRVTSGSPAIGRCKLASEAH